MKNKGISLIVLIITIVVIIILATAIILNIAQTNIIGNANEAVLKSRVSSIEEAINLWEMEQLMSNVSEDSETKTLEELLDELESQKLITTEERTTIESTGKVEIGSKTIEFAKVHEIGTKEDLEKFRDNVDNGNTYKNEIVKLTADIDLECNANDNSTWWNPIGGDTAFEGIFDGNGFTVIGMYCQAIDFEFNSFFARINNAKIKNLTVKGTSIALPQTSDEFNPAAAGIISVAKGNCEITNCINEVNVEKQSSGREIAGILGCVLAADNTDVVISNCINKGALQGANSCAGLVGTVYGKLTINDSYNEGTITNSYGNFVSGLVGRDGSNNGSITINNSYNTGTISGQKYIGGVVGYFGLGDKGNLYINNCYNTGEIKTTETLSNWAWIGGILGRAGNAVNELKLINTYNTTNITIESTNKKAIVGGLVGYNTAKNGNIINCYNTGNVTADYSGGLVGLLSGSTGDTPHLTLINSYNTGNITGTLYASTITRVHLAGATADFENVYYLDTSASIGVDNYTTDGVTAFDETYMKSEAFAKLLNNNIKGITEETNLKEWKYNVDNYPTL